MTDATVTPETLNRVLAAIELLRAHYARLRETHAGEVARELSAVLALLDEVDFAKSDLTHLAPSGHGVTRHLSGDLPSRNGTVADLLAAFRPLFPALPWRYSYEPRPDAPGLENSMAWAELIGPIAPFRSEKVCLGITAIGPRVRYPEHRHPAIETYYVLSGTARWTAEGVTHERAPGSFILHPSNIVHVMETGDEPLIAAYTWTGDVETLSSFTNTAA
jgi:quercetin dioxygenase-like cupin family protein